MQYFSLQIVKFPLISLIFNTVKYERVDMKIFCTRLQKIN